MKSTPIAVYYKTMNRESVPPDRYDDQHSIFNTTPIANVYDPPAVIYVFSVLFFTLQVYMDGLFHVTPTQHACRSCPQQYTSAPHNPKSADLQQFIFGPKKYISTDIINTAYFKFQSFSHSHSCWLHFYV